MIRQIAFHTPHRQFDFVIVSQDDFEIPAWAEAMGIVLHRPGEVPDVGNTKRFNGSRVPMFRILLAKELGHRYRRILYLDSDMFIEGGDFVRLLDINIGPHPFAAVRDAPTLYEPNHHAKEFKAAGLPVMPYFNSGLLLIDTEAFNSQEVAARCWAAAETYPLALAYADQSLLNLAVQGRFAELAPYWNWQGDHRFPLVTLRYPVYIRHFIGSLKPTRDPAGLLDARFRQAYADFFRNHMPDQLEGLALPCDPTPMRIGQASNIVLRHLQAKRLMSAGLGLFADPWDVKL